MSDVFVDTAAWLALLNSRDKYHKDANQMMAKLRQQKQKLITTDFVLLEVADALAAPDFRAQTIRFINSLRQTPFLTIVPVSKSLYEEAWQFYSKRPDKAWGLTDCSSFVIMQQEHITVAFTADHYFVQAGYQKLLE
ncbi:MAG: type II toxin-antitoxin system VapC family toxin [Chloroflexi bacterium]|nr:type II toxin-antitoxin system VapC family toxin [Ardenticatenaceae bacterium]MBL1128077.1 PIN domain-containing protein [Chloroflexota bacterium]NOG34148.1 type II toxin-antitoxin system VapC family toxin [Chloroflexota bacterium]GIK56853.1 MAG: hypothetical protein BroJett015_25160 [Chloroflexota bacterium]